MERRGRLWFGLYFAAVSTGTGALLMQAPAAFRLSSALMLAATVAIVAELVAARRLANVPAASRLPAGAMLAVALREEETAPLLDDGLSVAAVNGPALTVVAGIPEEVERLASLLAERGIATRTLPTTHAFHSRMMEPIAGAVREVLASVRLRAPEIPYVSNVTGTWVTAQEATDPDAWVAHG